jgi:transposase
LIIMSHTTLPDLWILSIGLSINSSETSARKGQDYVSLFADLDARRVVFATEGRSADTVARFAVDLVEHGGDPEKVTDTSSDMSTVFISGIGSTCRTRE